MNHWAADSTFTELSGVRIAELTSSDPPLNEQKRIVSRIEELQLRSRRAREALETVPDLLEQLRQSLLAAAFRGDLTKEWRKKNPDVEPASELLKRIRAERRKRWEEAELEKLKAKGLMAKNSTRSSPNAANNIKSPPWIQPICPNSPKPGAGLFHGERLVFARTVEAFPSNTLTHQKVSNC